MNKQITELKLNEIETVVGGVTYATMSAYSASATLYKAPTSSTTWSAPSAPTSPTLHA